MTLSIAAALLEATSLLRGAGVSEARRDATSLLGNVLDRDRTFLITHAEQLMTAEDLEVFRGYVARRAGGEPLQYIIGYQEFFGLDFEVNKHVLIPRPETELLVETALELIGDVRASPLICDLGTGSGCIAITLLHQRSLARAVAVDISADAAIVASRNAARHQVSSRISFVVADCLTALRKRPGFNLIVSNPPYVADKELDGLQREVREHEPRVALMSGSEGLSMIRGLLSEAPAFLIAGAYLVMEIGYGQLSSVEELVDPRIWKLLSVGNDLQGIPRTVALQKMN